MGLRAVMPGRHTSRRSKQHAIYPYLLRNLNITRPNQVWAIDITYIPLAKGYMYLIAIIDLHSRYVLNWSVANSMDAAWCKEALEQAIDQYGKPEIINTDQGSQFTSDEFSSYVLSQGIKLSMDGKGRATDNAFIERFNRTLRQDVLDAHLFEEISQVRILSEEWMRDYNNHRPHESLEGLSPSLYEKKNKIKKERLIPI